SPTMPKFAIALPPSVQLPHIRQQEKLIDRGAGFLCDLAPPRRFGRDKRCKVFGRLTGRDIDAATGKALFYLRRFHRREQRCMNLVDDRPRRSRGNEYTLP